MKKKIAIMLSIILMAGTFTACTAEETMDNSSLSPTVSTSVGVSASGESSEMATTETTTTAEKTTVSKETEPSGQNTKTEEKADSGQKSAVVSVTNPIQKTQSEVKNNSRNTVNSNHSKSKSNAEKETEIPTEKPTQKPTQPPTKAKTVDVQYAVSACIAYGQQLGMKYDSSLNTGNASWFSPTNASYYDDTQSLTADCYGDVEYVAYYFQSSGITPSDLSFNVITENNKIYVVYC